MSKVKALELIIEAGCGYHGEIFFESFNGGRGDKTGRSVQELVKAMLDELAVDESFRKGEEFEGALDVIRRSPSWGEFVGWYCGIHYDHQNWENIIEALEIVKHASASGNEFIFDS